MATVSLQLYPLPIDLRLLSVWPPLQTSSPVAPLAHQHTGGDELRINTFIKWINNKYKKMLFFFFSISPLINQLHSLGQASWFNPASLSHHPTSSNTASGSCPYTEPRPCLSAHLPSSPFLPCPGPVLAKVSDWIRQINAPHQNVAGHVFRLLEPHTHVRKPDNAKQPLRLVGCMLQWRNCAWYPKSTASHVPPSSNMSQRLHATFRY